MRVAITGHTSGIGAAIADAFRARGDEIVGLSRTTGYDLAKDRERIVEAAAQCDAFVNNRHQYNDDTQLQLLFALADAWKGQDKPIINLGSRAGECYVLGRSDPYSVYKHALDAACQQFFNREDQRPRVVNIRPGWVDTESVQGRAVPKLSPRDVANVVMWVIDQPAHVYVSSVTLAHHVTHVPARRRSVPSRILSKGLGSLRAVRRALGGVNPEKPVRQVEERAAKVAVTGHTSGIGLAIADAFRARGDDVVGLSRSTGYDLTSDREKIVQAAAKCDIFVNNRHQYDDDTQIQLLFALTSEWKGQDKTIINLGSRAGERYLLGGPDPHSVYKRALDAACQQLFNRPDQRPRVVNIRPGWVDTESVRGTEAPKLSPADVARVAMWVIDQPPHVYVSSVSLARHATESAAQSGAPPGG